MSPKKAEETEWSCFQTSLAAISSAKKKSLQYNAPKFSYNISPSLIFLKSYKIISKSDMRLEAVMENKISEKFVAGI
jgi:hypothetical protein